MLTTKGWLRVPRNRALLSVRAPMASCAAVLPLIIFLVAAGCARTATLYNPPRASFLATDTGTVERAIMDAMSGRGWVPSREAPGVILGTLHLRSHTAVVRVEYNSDSYQVTYVSSDDLKYRRNADGTEMIHRNYNSWVQNLVNDINARLAAMDRPRT